MNVVCDLSWTFNYIFILEVKINYGIIDCASRFASLELTTKLQVKHVKPTFISAAYRIRGSAHSLQNECPQVNDIY